jgi:hypothetical protein
VSPCAEARAARSKRTARELRATSEDFIEVSRDGWDETSVLD